MSDNAKALLRRAEQSGNAPAFLIEQLLEAVIDKVKAKADAANEAAGPEWIETHGPIG